MDVCGRCKSNPKAGKSHYCVDCRREKHYEWRKKNPERWRALSAKSRAKRLSDPAKLAKERARTREYWRDLRQEVITAYGGKCICCGETERSFLSLDHVNNDGAEHRRALGYGERNGIGASSATLRWAKKNGYPNTLQVLCVNCNMSKQINNGVCAHRLQTIQKTS